MKLILLLLSLSVIVSCAHSRGAYPKSWWKEVGQEEAASWEIVPQSAKDGEVILSKKTELGIFSNFAATPIFFKGRTFASLEGLWQSLKYPEDKKDPRYKMTQWPHTRKQVEAMIGFEAKRAGDFASQVMKKNNLDWVSFNGQRMKYRETGESDFYKLIREATIAKIEQNPKVKQLLVATGDLVLKPDHHQKKGSPKAWRYYEIYMDLRKDYR